MTRRRLAHFCVVGAPSFRHQDIPRCSVDNLFRFCAHLILVQTARATFVIETEREHGLEGDFETHTRHVEKGGLPLLMQNGIVVPFDVVCARP